MKCKMCFKLNPPMKQLKPTTAEVIWRQTFVCMEGSERTSEWIASIWAVKPPVISFIYRHTRPIYFSRPLLNGAICVINMLTDTLLQRSGTCCKCPSIIRAPLTSFHQLALVMSELAGGASLSATRLCYLLITRGADH